MIMNDIFFFFWFDLKKKKFSTILMEFLLLANFFSVSFGFFQQLLMTSVYFRNLSSVTAFSAKQIVMALAKVAITEV